MQETLCWNCKHTNRDECPWFDPDDPQPVEGWEAIRVDGRAYIGTSYTVLRCPKFDRIEPRKMECCAHPGICFDKQTGDYVAYMMVRKRPLIIGKYKHVGDAITARSKYMECRDHPGIYYDDRMGMFVAYMVAQKQIEVVGQYDNIGDAIRARKLAERLEAERVKQGN